MLHTIAERSLFARGDRVLVALSGGPDSTALLHTLARIAPRLDLTLAAACIDHGLRSESAEEARTVAAGCAAAGVPCEVQRVDVAARRGAHVSWQDAARRARLDALERIADRAGFTRIALGHTADDQVETLLQRIVRGTGLVGLQGIPYERGRFVRPLLEVRRTEILAFLRRQALPFLEDPSNADPRFTRARVRREWLPLLRRENPRVDEALLRLAADARESASAPSPNRRASASANTLANTLANLAARGVNRRTVAVVARLAREGRGTKRVAIPGGMVEVRYGDVLVQPCPAPGPSEAASGSPAKELPVGGPGTYDLGEGPALALTVVDVIPDPGAAVATWAFDAALVPFPLRLRTARPGDRMRPRGGRGSRKLQDLFVDARIPRPTRWRLPVLVAGDGEILVVPGLRPAARGAPNNLTQRLVVVQVGAPLPSPRATSAAGRKSPEFRGVD